VFVARVTNFAWQDCWVGVTGLPEARDDRKLKPEKLLDIASNTSISRNQMLRQCADLLPDAW